MKRMKLLAGTICVAAVLAASNVYGAGFGIYEGSARGNALATEITADPASPSVIYNNPAAMTELPGTQVEAGVTLINPAATVVTDTPAGQITTKAKSKWWTPPGAYVTHQFNDQIWAGVGVFSRFGLGIEYDNNWPGRYNVQKATIQSLDINPSMAVKVMDNLSLAAGVRAQWLDFELFRAIPTGRPFVDPDLQLRIAGDNWGIGYNLGVFFQATEWLSLGLAYDSEIKQEVEGDYTVKSPLGTVASGGGGGDIDTPSILRFGASAKATDKLTINAGIVYTMWSSYDQLAITFDPPLLGQIPASVTEKDWRDVLRYQLAAEYALDETWALRAGYIYDRTPDPDVHVDYIVPANHRHLLSAGIGYQAGDFFCDLAYTYLFIQNRTISGRPQDGVFSGKFKDGDAHMIGISVGYKL